MISSKPTEYNYYAYKNKLTITTKEDSEITSVKCKCRCGRDIDIRKVDGRTTLEENWTKTAVALLILDCRIEKEADTHGGQ